MKFKIFEFKRKRTIQLKISDKKVKRRYRKDHYFLLNNNTQKFRMLDDKDDDELI